MRAQEIPFEKYVGEEVVTNTIITKGKKTFIAGEKVKAIDTVGAGDCFVGAMSYGILNGKDLLAASKFANKVASISVSKKGAAASMPFLKEIPDLNY